MSVRRSACAICSNSDLRPILDLGYSPLADRFPATQHEPEDRYRLDLLRCAGCGLVQLGELVEDEILFGRDYSFFTSASPSLLDHYADYAHLVIKSFPEECAQGVLEIASNDGSLLKHFKDSGFPVLGVDPALPPAEAALERGINTLIRPFSSALVPEIIEVGPSHHLGRKPGVIIANNVIAHVADPVDFVRGIDRLLAPDGVAIIEFQYLLDLFYGNEWDHVYHEHRTYLTLDALRGAIAAAGSDLRLLDVEHQPTQGGSVRVYLRRRAAATQRTAALSASEASIREEGAFSSFQGRVEHSRRLICDILTHLRERGRTVAGYGASAKSSTLLNFCGITARDLAYVADATPYKIGRFTPGTHIPIVGPGERKEPDVYLLLVWNYLGGVIRRERRFLEAGGQFLVPIPHPVLL